MLRILHIIPRLRKGGAERLCLDICNELQKRDNVQVRLITFSEDNSYTFLTENIDWLVVPASVELSVFRTNHYNVDELQKAIEEFSPDVIHTHLFEAEIVSRSVYYPWATWFSHCHDNMKQFRNWGIHTLFSKELFTNYFEKQYLLRRYTINGGNTFICISKDTEQYFEQVASDFENVFLPNAIRYNMFNKPKTYSEEGKLRLINVGSYQAKKNQVFLLEVAKILRNRNVCFSIDLLGDGELYLEIDKKIQEYQLQNVVFQQGQVDTVETYLWESNIYIHSALYEPLGLVLLEAMAAGLPVVTLDGKGNRDLIEEGKNGYMIYEQNPELFADKILEIWNDKRKYQEMSLYAQEYAKQYDIVPYVDKLLCIYTTNYTN